MRMRDVLSMFSASCERSLSGHPSIIVQPRSKKTWFSADDMSEAKAQSYMVIGKCTRQRLMGPYNVDTQRDPTPSVYIHCIASNGVERSQDQKHDEGMWDLSRDLSGISLGSLLVLDPWACVPSIEFSL